MGTKTGRNGNALHIVNVGEVLTASLRICLREADLPVHISREFDDQLRVVCVRDELEQVFVGLLRNAVESLAPQPAGARAIRVAGWRTAEERICVEISDTGGGISPEHVDRVFESSFTTKLDQGSAGYGLETCQRLLSGWGGTLSVRTTSTRGTSFRVELPSQPPSS
jgi:two-component system, NtrC family, sensor kinase